MPWHEDRGLGKIPGALHFSRGSPRRLWHPGWRRGGTWRAVARCMFARTYLGIRNILGTHARLSLRPAFVPSGVTLPMPKG